MNTNDTAWMLQALTLAIGEVAACPACPGCKRLANEMLMMLGEEAKMVLPTLVVPPPQETL